MALSLTQELVVYTNVALRRSTQKNLARTLFHIFDCEFINLTVVGAAEYFQLQDGVRAFVIDTFGVEVYDDIGLADVNEHVVFQDDAASVEGGYLLLEASRATECRQACLLEHVGV